MPSWGAPAGADINKSVSQNSPAPLEHQGDSPGRYQRPGPYPNNTHGQFYSNNRGSASPRNSRGSPYSKHTRGRQSDSEIALGRGHLDTPPHVNSPGGPSGLRSDNPYQNQAIFSPDNPFQGNRNNSFFSPDNPFSNRDTSSPTHGHRPTHRPLFSSSPLVRTPNGQGHRFPPQTSGSFNNQTPPSGRFQSPSARYQTPPQGRYQSGGNSRGFSGSAKRGFGNRNGSFNNPGGSDDIQQYIHNSMLEDPWRDLPPKPMLDTY